MKRVFVLSLALVVSISSSAISSTVTIVNLQTNDLVYSPLDNTIYASVPNASVKNPNSLTPINPATGALGSPIAIGFDPQNVVISSDGSMIYTVYGGKLAVQPLAIPSQTFGTPIVITGGPTISQLRAVPGQANAVVISTRAFGNSNSTGVWQNGVLLPDVVGTGPGVGGPDIIAVDRSNGTRAYGYDNSNTAYANWSMTIGANGIDVDGGPTLQGILTGSNVGHIELLGNRLFDDRGEVFSLSPAIQVGAFSGGSNFVLDPANSALFSVTTSGSTQTLHEYSLSNFQQLGTATITGVSGTTNSLTRFGTDGLAFRTSNNQVVLFSGAVPEPSSIVLAICGLLSVLSCRKLRPRRPSDISGQGAF